MKNIHFIYIYIYKKKLNKNIYKNLMGEKVIEYEMAQSLSHYKKEKNNPLKNPKVELI